MIWGTGTAGTGAANDDTELTSGRTTDEEEEEKRRERRKVGCAQRAQERESRRRRIADTPSGQRPGPTHTSTRLATASPAVGWAKTGRRCGSMTLTPLNGPAAGPRPAPPWRPSPPIGAPPGLSCRARSSACMSGAIRHATRARRTWHCGRRGEERKTTPEVRQAGRQAVERWMGAEQRDVRR